MPNVNIHKRYQPKKRKPKQKNFHLFPSIISLLFVIASKGPIDSFSAIIKNVIEYDNAAIIPGIISRRDQRNIKIVWRRYAPSETPNLLNPLNIWDNFESCFLEMDNEKIHNPTDIGPNIIKKLKPSISRAQNRIIKML